MENSLIKREINKFRKNWKLYAVMVFLFSFLPLAVGFLWRSYYPFDVTDANIQPFPVVEEVVEPGGTVTYLIDVEKFYPFPGTVNRYLFSEECGIFEPIQPPVESNRAPGRIKGSTTIRIPDTLKPCPYILVIDTVFHPTSLRSLPLIQYTTDEFLVTERKEEISGLKAQVESLDEFIEDKVIDEKGEE